MNVTNPHDLRELAWTARSFGQAKALAVAACRNGRRAEARCLGAEARREWTRLSNYLRAEGALLP